MRNLGILARDSKGNLFQYKRDENNFYVLIGNKFVMSDIEDFEIMNVFHLDGTDIPRIERNTVDSICTESRYINDVKEGAETRRDILNDYLIYEGFYKSGKREGEWREYHENGRIKSIKNYEGGKLHGLIVSFTDEGNPIESLYYDNGNLDGICTTYFPSGSTKTRVEYLDGKRHGNWKEYDEDRMLIQECNYKDGMKNGSFVTYKEGVICSLVKYIKDEKQNITTSIEGHEDHGSTRV